MPTPDRETLLCRYHYDPLDRLANSTPFEQPTQRYYCKTRLATEIQGSVHRSILQHDDQLLAQQQPENGKIAATLLATDQQRSVLTALDANQPNFLAYSPYGHRPLENGLLSLLGFNGERPDPVTGHYHLGNGYRQFNPVLMRFNSPDSWSPFGEGGLNAYAYCEGDPVNSSDPSGHWKLLPGSGLIAGSLAPPPRAARTFTRSRIHVEPPIPGSQVPQSAYDAVIPGRYYPAPSPEIRARYLREALDHHYSFPGPNETRTDFYAALGMTPDGALLSSPVAGRQISSAASTVPSTSPLLQPSDVQRMGTPSSPPQRTDTPQSRNPRRPETSPPSDDLIGVNSVPRRIDDVRGNR